MKICETLTSKKSSFKEKTRVLRYKTNRVVLLDEDPLEFFEDFHLISQAANQKRYGENVMQFLRHWDCVRFGTALIKTK